jgi:hypothetical protein
MDATRARALADRVDFDALVFFKSWREADLWVAFFGRQLSFFDLPQHHQPHPVPLYAQSHDLFHLRSFSPRGPILHCCPWELLTSR